MDDNELFAVRTQIAALSNLVETLLAMRVADSADPETADALVASLRRISGRTDHFVADDDQHAPKLSDFETRTHEETSLIVERAVAHGTALKHVRESHRPL